MNYDDKSRHDFKNQLAIIRGFAEILLDEAAAGDPRRRDLGKHSRLCSCTVFVRGRHDEDAEFMTLSLQDVYAANILDTVRQPLLLLSADLRVVTANPAFYDMCHLTPAEADDQLVYELGHGEWRDPHLRELLEEILPARIELKDFELRQSLPGVAADAAAERTVASAGGRCARDDPARYRGRHDGAGWRNSSMRP